MAFAAGHLVEIEFDAEVALGAHFDSGAGEAGSTHVLNGDDGTRGHEFEAGFQQALFGEGVAHLHGRALLFRLVVEFGRGHGGPVDAVAARLGAEIDDRQAHAFRLRVKDLVGVGDPDRHGVHENVAVVAGMEVHFARHRRHAKGVAIAAHARNDAAHEVAGLRVIGRAEAERVHRRDGACAHGEDITQDAAHASRGALIGFDEGGVVVALHLEDDGLAVAHVDHAGVLARALDDARPLRRQLPEPLLR